MKICLGYTFAYNTALGQNKSGSFKKALSKVKISPGTFLVFLPSKLNNGSLLQVATVLTLL